MPVSLCSMTWMPLMRCSGLTAGEFDEFVDFAGVGGDCHFLTVPLVGVDPPDRRCHGVLLLEVKLRWVRDRQGRFVTTESRQSGSLQHRSAPAGPTLDATGQSTRTKPELC